MAKQLKTIEDFQALIADKGIGALNDKQLEAYQALLTKAPDAPPDGESKDPDAPESATFAALALSVWVHSGIGCGYDGFFAFNGVYRTTSDPGEIAALRRYATDPAFAGAGVVEIKE
jgi:hypothetical protein